MKRFINKAFKQIKSLASSQKQEYLTDTINTEKLAHEGNIEQTDNNLGIPEYFTLEEMIEQFDGVDDIKDQARNGVSDAQFLLGQMYEMGKIGTLGSYNNYEKARAWYEKAMAQGNHDAIYHLGRMYELGLGVQIDYDMAIQLYQKSADLGNFLATFILANRAS